MVSILCLLQGVILGQGPAPPPASLGQPAVVVSTAPAEPAFGEGQVVGIASNPAEVTSESAASSSIFARPIFADRNSLSWVLGAGRGRFNLIDWESQPNADHLWWLGRWPSSEQVQLYAQVGFNIHWWAGPVQNGAGAVPDLPPRVYDLFVDCSWAQRWTDRFITEFRVQPGLYTDFRTTPPDAFRAPGHAIGLFRVDPELYLVGGVEHLQRNDVKILPVGGVLWQPSPGCEFRLVFPDPKIAVELSSRHHLWGYVAAEYGGGRWTYKNDAGHSERVEYSDYRVTFGIEWREGNSRKLPLLSERVAGYLEMGYVFERQLRFTGSAPGFEPGAAWMIRFGHTW